MERSQTRAVTTKRGLKRKLEEDFREERVEGEPDRKVQPVVEQQDDRPDLVVRVREQVQILESKFSSAQSDRLLAKQAAHGLALTAKEEELVDILVDCGAVPALVKHLRAPAPAVDGRKCPIPYEHEVEKYCAYALGLIAIKLEYQQLVVDAGALPHLVDLLKRHKRGSESPAPDAVIRRACDTIAHIAHENGNTKNLVRIEGGIPPLVELLNFFNTKVQIAAAGALRTLAFKNDENKNQIVVECGALPTLVLMLQSEDPVMSFEAVGVIGNLVHSSPHIKKLVLLAGALQPIIGLLSSDCMESQREAALLLGQFAATDTDCKAHIVQRGALKPLIEMLKSPDAQVKEMSAFTLGRLAQEIHNQAGIAQNGGIKPLIELLGSENISLQHNAAFCLYGLADNEDNTATIIKFGGVQKLQDGEFIAQQTRECVAKSLKRLEEKICGRVLNHLLYMMRVEDKATQRRVALALAHLCNPSDRENIFISNKGLELLLGLLNSPQYKEKHDGSLALYKLATKATSLSRVDAAPPSPSPQVYLGEQYVNNPTFSDITFLVEGKQFYAHRICLLASSDAFRAMFDGGYRERDARDVVIPNIRWEVFELMMRFIYTGSVNVNMDIAQDLLRAADQYLLEGLKRLCEHAIVQDICVENLSFMFEFSEALNAMSLQQACILFLLEQFDKLVDKPWYPALVDRVISDIRAFFTTALQMPGLGPLRNHSLTVALCPAISPLSTLHWRAAVSTASLLAAAPQAFECQSFLDGSGLPRHHQPRKSFLEMNQEIYPPHGKVLMLLLSLFPVSTRISSIGPAHGFLHRSSQAPSSPIKPTSPFLGRKLKIKPTFESQQPSPSRIAISNFKTLLVFASSSGELIHAVHDMFMGVGLGLPCTVMECDDIMYRSTSPQIRWLDAHDPRCCSGSGCPVVFLGHPRRGSMAL
ncbi:hypothetical protein C1H46_015096 [Malus baccata]|uniref:BTB domain-containing protein n=1 Tax=Malus baccata TaxID=106549 RepID=A0A540MKJ4_MALBA|nr:hypothetical protein C1H46_015096 [Malus baccata]